MIGEPLLAGAVKVTDRASFCEVIEEMTGAAGADGVVNEVVGRRAGAAPVDRLELEA